MAARAENLEFLTPTDMDRTCGVRSKPSHTGGNLELRNLANYDQGTQ
jgi:hypothetical protein